MTTPTTPLRAVVCDDEPLARETLRDFVGRIPGLVLVGEAADGRQAVSLVGALKPDLVFLDIRMPELDGLGVVRALRGLAPWPAIVFTTAHDHHAVTAFELQALDYLLKPFSFERFEQAVQRARSRPGVSPEAADAALGDGGRGRLDRLLVRDRGQIFPLSPDEIVYLKADTKYTLIAARGRQYLVRVALADLEPRLDPTRFMRVHRNAIVNLDHVTAMRPDEQSQLALTMRDGTVLTANREASRRLRDAAL